MAGGEQAFTQSQQREQAASVMVREPIVSPGVSWKECSDKDKPLACVD